MKTRRLLALTVVLAALLSVWQVSLTSAGELPSPLGCGTPTPTPSPPPPGTGTIVVHKFHDLNRNGVQDEGEPDIEGWLIRLYIWVGENLELYAEGRTGSDGTITFTDLEPRRYKVWEEERPCWEPTTEVTHWRNVGGYFQIVRLHDGETINVTFGNVYVCRLILEPDEAENVLPQDTSHEFTATVLDGDEPVVGVWVSFSTDFGYFEGDGQYVEVLTNEAGQATVTVVSTTPGVAHIRAWVDENGDDLYVEGELTDEPSVKSWVLAPPSLEVGKTAEPALTTSYAWSVEKVTEPSSLELELGESGQVTYAIEVQRTVGDETYTVSGVISAQNAGGTAAELVSVVDCVEYLMEGSDEYTTLQCETVQEGGTVEPSATETWDYTLEFEPVEGAVAYRNRADVTISNHPEGEYTYTAYADFDLPERPTDEVDACATVTDEQEIPDGFTATDDYPEGGWTTCESATFTVRKTVTNESAEPGTYELTNVAAVAGEDSGEGPSDSAVVTLIVPAAPPSLEVTKTVTDTLWEVTYDWGITKSVDKPEVEAAPGEIVELVYTIEVVREVAEESYIVYGTISAENTGGTTAQLVDVVDCIEYLPEGGQEYVELLCETVQTDGTIAPDATEMWEYTVEFEPVEGAVAYRNRADVTISNHPEGVYTYSAFADFDPPTEPTNEVDACATVTDEQVLPEGFTATDDYPEGGWTTCEPGTFTINKELTVGEDVAPGYYDLVNTATVTEEDTGESAEASATVEIQIVGEEPSAPSGFISREGVVGGAPRPAEVPSQGVQSSPTVPAEVEPPTEAATAVAPIAEAPADGGVVAEPVALAAEPPADDGAVAEPVFPMVEVESGEVQAATVPAGEPVSLSRAPAPSPAPPPPAAPVAAAGTALINSLAGVAWLIGRRRWL